jgi:hypothetical protein
VLLRPRDELVAMHEKLECAEIDVMISLLNDVRKKAGALAAMIDEAYSRVLIVDERASTRRTIQRQPITIPKGIYRRCVAPTEMREMGPSERHNQSRCARSKRFRLLAGSR